jgi:hypothetical protein
MEESLIPHTFRIAPLPLPVHPTIQGYLSILTAPSFNFRDNPIQHEQ